MPSSPSPPEHFCERLAAQRREGVDFEAAWAAAWRTFRWSDWIEDTPTRHEWQASLKAMKHIWRAGFYRERVSDAVAMLAAQDVSLTPTLRRESPARAYAAER